MGIGENLAANPQKPIDFGCEIVDTYDMPRGPAPSLVTESYDCEAALRLAAERGWDQYQFCSASKMSYSVLTKWRASGSCTEATAIKAAFALGVPLERLVKVTPTGAEAVR